MLSSNIKNDKTQIKYLPKFCLMSVVNFICEHCFSREILDGKDSLEWIATFQTATSIEMPQEIPAIAIPISFFKRETLCALGMSGIGPPPWKQNIEIFRMNALELFHGWLGLLEGFEMYENMTLEVSTENWVVVLLIFAGKINNSLGCP